MERWEDQAACIGSPTGWFVVDSGNYAPGLAVKVCSKCPVKTECVDNAIDDDRLYTIRGGFMPNTNDLPIEERPCRKGHVGAWFWVDAPSKQFWRCRECKRDDDRKHYEKAKNKNVHRHDSNTCKHGHVGEYRIRLDGRKECGACVRNWDNLRNAKKRKERADAKMNA